MRRPMSSARKIQKIVEYQINPTTSSAYSKKDMDYFKAELDNLVHAAEIKGERKEQEDFHTSFELSQDFKHSTHEQTTIAIQKTFETLNNECKNRKLAGGAAACMSIAWVEEKKDQPAKTLRICTANAGDVSSFCFIMDAKNNIVRAERLNEHLHSIDENKNLKENIHWKRSKSGIPRLGGYFDKSNNYHLNGNGLMMTKSIGDAKYDLEVNGELLHTCIPDVKFYEIPLKNGETPYIITGCDGLTDIIMQFRKSRAMHETLIKLFQNKQKANVKVQPIIKYKNISVNVSLDMTDVEFVGAILKATLNMAKPNTNLAWELVNFAYTMSTDNITASVLSPSSRIVADVVLDGHGERGSNLHQIIGALFPTVFIEKMAEQLPMEAKHSSVLTTTETKQSQNPDRKDEKQNAETKKSQAHESTQSTEFKKTPDAKASLKPLSKKVKESKKITIKNINNLFSDMKKIQLSGKTKFFGGEKNIDILLKVINQSPSQNSDPNQLLNSNMNALLKYWKYKYGKKPLDKENIEIFMAQAQVKPQKYEVLKNMVIIFQAVKLEPFISVLDKESKEFIDKFPILASEKRLKLG